MADRFAISKKGPRPGFSWPEAEHAQGTGEKSAQIFIFAFMCSKRDPNGRKADPRGSTHRDALACMKKKREEDGGRERGSKLRCWGAFSRPGEALICPLATDLLAHTWRGHWWQLRIKQTAQSSFLFIMDIYLINNNNNIQLNETVRGRTSRCLCYWFVSKVTVLVTSFNTCIRFLDPKTWLFPDDWGEKSGLTRHISSLQTKPDFPLSSSVSHKWTTPQWHTIVS